MSTEGDEDTDGSKITGDASTHAQGTALGGRVNVGVGA